MAENNIIFCTFLYSFCFRFFFSLWYFSMQILCSLHSFSRSARWLRYWCAEIMNYETFPPPPPRSPLFIHAYWWDAIHIFLYIRSSHTENYSWRPALSPTVYNMVSHPLDGILMIYVYYIRRRRRRQAIISLPPTTPRPGTLPNGNSFRVSSLRRRRRRRLTILL